MENQQDTNTKSKVFKMTLDDYELRQVLFLMKHLDKKTPQKLLKTLIDLKHEEAKNAELRYAKGNSPLQVRRANQDSEIAKLKAMSIEALNAYLLEIGYLKPKYELPDSAGTFQEDLIIANEFNLEPEYIQKTTYSNGSGDYTRSILMGIDSIVTALIKEKLI